MRCRARRDGRGVRPRHVEHHVAIELGRDSTTAGTARMPSAGRAHDPTTPADPPALVAVTRPWKKASSNRCVFSSASTIENRGSAPKNAAHRRRPGAGPTISVSKGRLGERASRRSPRSWSCRRRPWRRRTRRPRPWPPGGAMRDEARSPARASRRVTARQPLVDTGAHRLETGPWVRAARPR